MAAKLIVFCFLAFMLYNYGRCQGVTITDDSTHQPDSSSILDLFSAEKGMLLPRLTASQIQSLHDPADGLVVYNTSDGKVYVYRDLSSSWKAINFGSEVITPFTCGGTWYDFRDGKTYSTVLINGRCWFAQNLNVGTLVTNTSGQGNNQVIEKFCYNNSETNCNYFGGLYYFNEAMNYSSQPGSTGICPEGWHIPTDHEWHQMEMYMDNTITDTTIMGWRGTDCGGKLKETGTTWWTTPNTGATNSSGFSARGGGEEFYISFPGSHMFAQIYNYGYFWTSTYVSSFTPPMYYGPCIRYLGYNSQQSGRGYDDNMSGNYAAFSIRCIKD